MNAQETKDLKITIRLTASQYDRLRQLAPALADSPGLAAEKIVIERLTRDETDSSMQADLRAIRDRLSAFTLDALEVRLAVIEESLERSFNCVRKDVRTSTRAILVNGNRPIEPDAATRWIENNLS